MIIGEAPETVSACPPACRHTIIGVMSVYPFRGALAVGFVIATGCSGGTDPALLDLYDHAAHVTVVMSTTGDCDTGISRVPLNVVLEIDGWRDDPERVEGSPFAISTTFEPGSHDAYLMYNAYNCNAPFYSLEGPLRRDEHRLIFVTNDGALGTEEIRTAQLPYPPPRDGRTIYVFNLAGTEAVVGLDEDGDGAADSAAPVPPFDFAELVRASDADVTVVAEVGGEALSGTATAVFDVDPFTGSEATKDVRGCVIGESAAGRVLSCAPLTSTGIRHWLSDPAPRFDF